MRIPRFGPLPLRSHRFALALAGIVLVALALRLPVVVRPWLSSWDEAYHALVAKNLLLHPLAPTLLEHCPARWDTGHWLHTRVWLHKPPLSMWLMTPGLRWLGDAEWVVRLPSLLADLLLVVMIGCCGRKLGGPATGRCAASAWAVSAPSITLVGGLRATDHPDVLLCVLAFACLLLFSESEASASVSASDSAAEPDRPWRAFAAGLVTSLAILTKGLAGGLLVPAIALFLVARALRDPCTPGRCARWARWSRAGRAFSPYLAGAALHLPWTISCRVRFPVASAAERLEAWRHVTSVLEGHDGHLLAHFEFFARYMIGAPGWFGAVVGLVVVSGAIAHGLRRGDPRLELLSIWCLVVFGAYTLSATKMKFYCYPAFPALFVLLADGATRAFREAGEAMRRTRQGARFAVPVLGVLVLAPFTLMLVQTNDVIRRASDPATTRKQSDHYDCRDLRERMKALAADPAPALVWNARDATAIQASYYSDKTVLQATPSLQDLDEAEARGLKNYALLATGDDEDRSRRDTDWGRRVTWIEIRGR